MLNDDVTVARRRDTSWRTIPGLLVVATLDGTVHEATGTAPDVWMDLEHPISVGRLIEALAERYDADREQVRLEVIAFLNGLVEAELVELGESTDRPGRSADSRD